MSARLIQCPKCQTQLRVQADAAKIKCPQCQTVLNLSAAAQPASPVTPTPAPTPTPAAFPATPGQLPTSSAPPAFKPSFPPAARPSAAATPTNDSPPKKSQALLIGLGIGAVLLALCSIGGIGVAAYWALQRQNPDSSGAPSNPVTATVAMDAAPLPESWEEGEVLGAKASFPPGAIARSKADNTATHRVVSAQTSAVYELEVVIDSPPGDKPLDALESFMANRIDWQPTWEPVTRDGNSGFRAVLVQGKPAAARSVIEAYPHQDGWVLLSYQAFSQRPVAERPSRQIQEDEAELDMAGGFTASLELPSEYPTSTQDMNTQPRFRKLGEAERKQLYALYKVAYQQAHQKIKIPRGPARTRTENMLSAVLASEVKKMAALFDVSEAEVNSVGAEGRALAW